LLFLQPPLPSPATPVAGDFRNGVANSYNAQLRVRKISERILDDFPGNGNQRKQALLKKFGAAVARGDR
jgi:hypothetical protein